LKEEFELVKEVKDIIDELNIIEHVYKEQLSVVNPLYSANVQYIHSRRVSNDDDIQPALDELYWFKKTKSSIKSRLESVDDLMVEAERIYSNVGKIEGSI
jgi:hypothetical protein